MFGAISLSRPKPPQAVAEGQPLQGDSPNTQWDTKRNGPHAPPPTRLAFGQPDQWEGRALPTRNSKEPNVLLICVTFGICIGAAHCSQRIFRGHEVPGNKERTKYNPILVKNCVITIKWQFALKSEVLNIKSATVT
jgi:hypothetical protein